MAITRRALLAGGGAALAAGPFAGLVAGSTAAAGSGSTLRPTPDLRDGAVRLHLPAGFSYRSFHDTEQEVRLDDGTLLPGRHDGMGAFAGGGGGVMLVRNHEIPGIGPAFGPSSAATYDPMAPAGVTVVDVTGRGEVRRGRTALDGTLMNCSGGVMPWGSWVTCEETVNGPDVGPDFFGVPNTDLHERHGYVFEVSPTHGSAAEPVTQAGRFCHEAVSFDPHHGYLYLTEDNRGYPSGFYRYRPATNPLETGRLDNGGSLQMLAIVGEPNAHLEAAQDPGTTFRVTWVDIDDPEARFPYTPGEDPLTTNVEALVYVGDQGRAQGAALFSRLEGQVYSDGVVYFTSTQGGGAPMEGPDMPHGYGHGNGQVWAYDTRSQRLRLVYQSESREDFDYPDNITVSHRGTLVVCEDGSDDNYLRALTPRGRLWDLALNRVQNSRTGDPRYDDEFAGTTFSPDGRTLFVNIQADAGVTIAIWGDWHRYGI